LSVLLTLSVIAALPYLETEILLFKGKTFLKGEKQMEDLGAGKA
jgi:hypothetical protein